MVCYSSNIRLIRIHIEETLKKTDYDGGENKKAPVTKNLEDGGY